MITRTKSNQHKNDLGKCICVSFPLHELDLIDDLDDLARNAHLNKSQYLRQLVRREKQNTNK